VADQTDKDRSTDTRGSDRPQSGRIPPNSSERGVGDRARGERIGNPGVRLGTQHWNGMPYAKYQATKGTWISASLVDQGYNQFYGRDVAYGAYLGFVLDKDGKPLRNPDRISPGQEYFIPVGTAVTFEPQEVSGHRSPQIQISKSETWAEKPRGAPSRTSS
jgi:hypothetical protein